MPHNAPTSSEPVSDPEPQLSDRQLAAIESILTGSTLSDAAQKVGIDRKTLYRWRMHDQAFATELRERRTEAVQNCIDRLCNLLSGALDVLERQLKQSYAPISHRAAKTLLTLGGIGRATARIVAPPIAKPQAATHGAAGPSAVTEPVASKLGLSRSTARVLSQAVNAMDLLRLSGASRATG